jgi:hypothetical protein
MSKNSKNIDDSNVHLEFELGSSQLNSKAKSDSVKRVEIMCGLFDLAYELKSLELKRRNPLASQEWIREETLRLIEAGTR